jgi:hypothetical protein
MYNEQYEIFLLLMKFYSIKFADLVGAMPYCSINAAVDGYFLHARSAGVSPPLSFAFVSAPASMRALMISSGAPLRAVQCNAFRLYCYSVDCCVSSVNKSPVFAISHKIWLLRRTPWVRELSSRMSTRMSKSYSGSNRATMMLMWMRNNNNNSSSGTSNSSTPNTSLVHQEELNKIHQQQL